MTAAAELDVLRILEEVDGRHAAPYQAAIQDMLDAAVLGSRTNWTAARNRLAAVMRETLGLAEVVGAAITLRQAGGVLRDMGRVMAQDLLAVWRFKDDPLQLVLPRVTFAEAGQDLVDRAPVTIRDAAQRTWRAISELYSKDAGVIAFTRSAEQAVTQRAKAAIEAALGSGMGEAQAGRIIKLSVDDVRRETAEWTESYARMAFRTTLNGAVTAGRFRQAEDRDVRAVMPAFVFATGDVDVRPNHAAGDGVILAVGNPAWQRVRPPIGFNCRCRVDLLSRPMLRRMGRLTSKGEVQESAIPSGFHPDEGFRP